jgi:hypothetical protein
MHIRLTDGTNSSTLAAGSARALGVPIGPSALRISGPITAQAQPRLRAPATRFRNRGNMQTSIAFTSYFEFSTIAHAEIFALSYRTDVQREGSLIMRVEGGGESVVADCVLTDAAVTHTGVTVRVDYSIVGGETTFNLPEGVDADTNTMVDANGNTMVFQTA